jgi:hypothetical protein
VCFRLGDWALRSKKPGDRVEPRGLPAQSKDNLFRLCAPEESLDLAGHATTEPWGFSGFESFCRGTIRTEPTKGTTRDDLEQPCFYFGFSLHSLFLSKLMRQAGQPGGSIPDAGVPKASIRACFALAGERNRRTQSRLENDHRRIQATQLVSGERTEESNPVPTAFLF